MKIRNHLFIAPLLVLLMVLSAQAKPMKVIMLDFQDETGGRADDGLVGNLNLKKFTEKGVIFLQQALLASPAFTVIDRRDFVTQIEALRLRDGSDPMSDTFFGTRERPTPLSPTFFNAARSLKGDAIIRGSLLALSDSTEKINQGGYQAEFITLKLRVMLQALDTADGGVLAVEEGRSSRKFRQTSSVKTEIGEDDLLDLYRQAVAAAVPELEKKLQTKLSGDTEVKVWIATSADPAMIELDGILLGTSPLEGVAVAKGDHTLTVTRPGYETITKKLMLDGNMWITVPMISNQLNGEQRKEALSKMGINLLKIE